MGKLKKNLIPHNTAKFVFLSSLDKYYLLKCSITLNSEK